jgi:hypothetical protein
MQRNGPLELSPCQRDTLWNPTGLPSQDQAERVAHELPKVTNLVSILEWKKEPLIADSP